MPLLPVNQVAGTFDGTGAITLITSLPIDFRCTLEKIVYVAGVAHAGAGGTQTFKVRKGGATGTVIATLTVALADVGAVGAFKAASVAAADDEAAKLKDGDTLSFTRDASGTAYTTANGMFYLIFRQRPQARI
jgi:hypothetical protein